MIDLLRDPAFLDVLQSTSILLLYILVIRLNTRVRNTA